MFFEAEIVQLRQRIAQLEAAEATVQAAMAKVKEAIALVEPLGKTREFDRMMNIVLTKTVNDIRGHETTVDEDGEETVEDIDDNIYDCSHCGKPVSVEDDICHHCGEPAHSEVEVPKAETGPGEEGDTSDEDEGEDDDFDFEDNEDSDEVDEDVDEVDEDVDDVDDVDDSAVEESDRTNDEAAQTEVAVATSAPIVWNQGDKVLSPTGIKGEITKIVTTPYRSHYTIKWLSKPGGESIFTDKHLAEQGYTKIIEAAVVEPVDTPAVEIGEDGEVIPLTKPEPTELVQVSDAVSYLKFKGEKGKLLATYVGFNSKAVGRKWGIHLNDLFQFETDLRDEPKRLTGWKYELKITGISLHQTQMLAEEDLTKMPGAKKEERAKIGDLLKITSDRHGADLNGVVGKVTRVTSSGVDLAIDQKILGAGRSDTLCYLWEEVAPVPDLVAV